MSCHLKTEYRTSVAKCGAKSYKEILKNSEKRFCAFHYDSFHGLVLISQVPSAHNSREEANTLNKKWILTMLCAFALFLLAGCAVADVLPSPSPAATTPMTSPQILPSPLTDLSPSPGIGAPTSPAPGTSGAGITTMEDAKKVSQDIETELEKLSEVSEATVVAAGDTAVVGLTFDSQYKGGLTKRITDMVNDRIGTVNTGIQNIGVTAQAAQVKSIQDLAATMEKTGTTMATLKTQVDALFKTITANAGGATTAP